MTNLEDQIIAHTTAWIKSVVIGCNFCPFAAKAMSQKSIRYMVVQDATKENTLSCLNEEIHYLDEHEEIETTLIILPHHFKDFTSYLSLVAAAEKATSRQGYDGVYQIASFHPEYIFADATPDDPANYTNRSIYPMLHILREESITQALKHYVDPERIPQRNVEFSRERGLQYMQMLWAACLK
jgi:hypothetical protein